MKKLTVILFLISLIILSVNLLFSTSIDFLLIVTSILTFLSALLSLVKDLNEQKALKKEYEVYYKERIKSIKDESIFDTVSILDKKTIMDDELSKLSKEEQEKLQQIDKKISFLLENSRLDEVEGILNVLKEKYNFSFIFKRYGDLNTKKKDISKACKYYHDALKLNSHNHEARYNLSQCYFQLANECKSDNELISFYKKGLKYNDLVPEAFLNIGIAYLKLKKSKAIKYFNKAIELRPNYAKAFLSLGDYYSLKRDFYLAFKYYKKTLEIDKKFALVYERISMLYLKERELDKAYEYLEKALTIEPENQRIKDNLNKILKISESTTMEFK